MRVALFTETFLPKIDGIVSVLMLTLEHFQRRGIETVVVAHERGVREYAGARVIGVPGLPVPFYPELRFGPPNLGTYRQVKAFQPDIIHLIHPATIGAGGIFMARQLDVPYISSFHTGIMSMAKHFHWGPLPLGFMEPLLWAWTRWTFNGADGRLATSTRVKHELEAGGVRELGVWRRGVDAEKFNPCYRDAAMRDRLSDGHPDETILLYVGRLSPEKQIEQIGTALEAVPGTRLAIIGDGPYRATLEQHFAGTPTVFMGYMQGEALSQAYASADIFAFPSAWESFGLVVVEAMAAGLPVVSSRVGGVQDVVEEGVTGYTFDVDDIDGLVAGVRAIVSEPGARAQMGRDARTFAETQSWPVMMDELLDFYRAIIAERAAARAG
ncbi:MAG: glycosyltransferase family 1 protein [Anaerolineae bacterium]|nr:glycosyltransferase family 1 protein [Anaerolineae bacterium]